MKLKSCGGSDVACGGRHTNCGCWSIARPYWGTRIPSKSTLAEYRLHQRLLDNEQMLSYFGLRVPSSAERSTLHCGYCVVGGTFLTFPWEANTLGALGPSFFSPLTISGTNRQASWTTTQHHHVQADNAMQNHDSDVANRSRNGYRISEDNHVIFSVQI